MVRGLGVNHKSLLVPDVEEGSYAIEFQHANYLTKSFNINVGAALPTTFTEAMTEKSYDMAIDFVFPATTLLKDANIFDGEAITFNSLIITNNGNVDAYAWYTIAGAGVDIQVIDAGLLSPAEAVVIPIPDQPTTAGVGDHTINLNVGASTSTSWVDVLPTSDNRTETLHILAWSTDITFIATAPGITDLHGVDVFIDGVNMGTT